MIMMIMIIIIWIYIALHTEYRSTLLILLPRSSNSFTHNVHHLHSPGEHSYYCHPEGIWQ